MQLVAPETFLSSVQPRRPGGGEENNVHANTINFFTAIDQLLMHCSIAQVRTIDINTL
jgi:hypothetical protein